MSTLELDIQFQRGPEFELAVQLSLPPGQVLAIEGPSGCGKTTLFDLIAGLENPNRGTIRLGSEVWFDQSTSSVVKARHRSVGYMFQEFALFPHMTVKENLELTCFRSGVSDPASIVDIIKKLELAEFVDRKPDRLSGGQQQRLAFGRAILTGAKVLMLDEPFHAVEERLKDVMVECLREVIEKTGSCVLLASHDRVRMVRMVDQTYSMGRSSGQ